jgi:hypothetical protein
MRMEGGHPGVPLAEEEQALLAFAACAVTGPALADLNFERGQGGTILSGLVGRTVPSGDAIQAVALLVLAPEATYYLERPQDHAPEEAAELGPGEMPPPLGAGSAAAPRSLPSWGRRSAFSDDPLWLQAGRKTARSGAQSVGFARLVDRRRCESFLFRGFHALPVAG